MFALVDCNNFYVSCERVFNPGLIGKPVVVLSNNDGCIISRSEEAKTLGLKMAEPAFRKTNFLKQNNVQLFSSNYTLYADMSQRVIETLRSFSPEVEIYSIDECFIDLTGLTQDIKSIAVKIKEKVIKDTGIPVSIGIAPTKTLAKIASKAAKKTDGIFIIRNDHQRDSFIRNTSIDLVWGIGRQHYQRLQKKGIKTAFDYTCISDEWIKKNLTVLGLRLKKELLGKSCLPVISLQPPKKAIATTRAFGKKIENFFFIQEAVATYAVRCGEKLRKQKSVANLLTVFIHTDPFNPNEKQFSTSKTITLSVASNNGIFLVNYALKALSMIFKKGYLYKKAGVIVDGLEPENGVQKDIFLEADTNEQKQLTEVIDRINRKYGRDKIRLAIQGTGKEWKLRQEKLSLRYTTNIDEVIQIKCK